MWFELQGHHRIVYQNIIFFKFLPVWTFQLQPSSCWSVWSVFHSSHLPMFIMSLQGLMILLQNLPTMHWGNEEVSVLLAEAYRLKFAFADAPNHYKRWWECRLLPPPVLGPLHGGTILFPTPTPHFQWAFQLRDSVRTCGVASWSDNEPFCNISVWSALFFLLFLLVWDFKLHSQKNVPLHYFLLSQLFWKRANPA